MKTFAINIMNVTNTVIISLNYEISIRYKNYVFYEDGALLYEAF